MIDTPTYSLLLVDDDSFLVDMYSRKFTEGGHEVTSSFSATEALDKLRDGFTPDAIILDLVMPVIDGFAMLETIRKEKLAPEAALIVLSNQGEAVDLARTEELGVAGHIIKANAIPSEVLQLVNTLLAKFKSSQ